MITREPCAGVAIGVAALEDAVDLALSARRGGSGRAIHFCNAYTLSIAHTDPAYRELLRKAWLCLPDGQSVVWVRRLLDRRSRLQKVSGPDFFLAAFHATQVTAHRHYLLGSDEQTLSSLVANLSRRYPRADIVGYHSPPFRSLSSEETAAQDEAIRAAGADLVWVGLGTPKQDWEAARLAKGLPVTAVAVGAAFDFAAGTKRRAPTWMRSSGLEWMHRLASEPRRLWRRYLVGSLVFLWSAWRRSS